MDNGTLVAMDAVAWAPRWTVSTNAEPIAALADGGVLISNGETLTVLDGQGIPTEALSVSLNDLSIPLARGVIYGVADAEGNLPEQSVLKVVAGPHLDQSLFAYNEHVEYHRPRKARCAGDLVRSTLVHEYFDRGVTFYVPLCADIRSSLTSPYPHVTWESFTLHEKNTVSPLGIVWEFMAARVSDTIGAYQAETSRTVVVSSGYRTPKGNQSLPGASGNRSRHMSGEAVDLIVPGYLDGTHYGGGPNDTTSTAYITWTALLAIADNRGASNFEGWAQMYYALFNRANGFRVDGQNHLHPSWIGGHR
jgi:hypothetical protein